MEENMLCPQCYKASRKSADAVAPKIAKIALSARTGVCLQIGVQGQIEANLEALKALGFQWQEQASGILGYFNVKTESILAKSHVCASVEEVGEWVASVAEEINALGYELTNAIGPADIQWMRAEFQKLEESNRRLAEAKEKLAADPRPPAPEIITSLRAKGRWNGKIYGRKGGFNLYVDNEKIDISDSDAEEITKYTGGLNDWKSRHPQN